MRLLGRRTDLVMVIFSLDRVPLQVITSSRDGACRRSVKVETAKISCCKESRWRQSKQELADLSMTPSVPVWYCRHPGGPPSSLPHENCVTTIARGFLNYLKKGTIFLFSRIPLMSQERELVSLPMPKAALLHWAPASTMTAVLFGQKLRTFWYYGRNCLK